MTRTTTLTPEYLRAEAVRLATNHTPKSRLKGLQWAVEIVATDGRDVATRLTVKWSDRATGWDHEPVSERL